MAEDSSEMADENTEMVDENAHDHDHAHTHAEVTVDESFVPVRREGLASRDTDEGLVLFTPEGDTVRLNSTASILWQFFDGEVTVGELIDDIAAVYDLSRGEVAGDVTGVVADLSARRVVLHPDIDLDADAHRTSTTGAKYRPDGCTPCGKHLEDRAWEAKSVVKLGDYHLGIRSSHAAIDEVVRDLLADYLIEDAGAPNDYSIWLETDEATGATTIDLFDYHASVWRSGSMLPIRRALLTKLARIGDPVGHLWINGIAIVGPKGAAILPPALTPIVSFASDRLADLGFKVTTSPVAVDTKTREIVVGTPGLNLDNEHEKSFDALADWEDRSPALADEGRYPLVAWCIVPEGTEGSDLVEAMANGLPAVDNRQELGIAATVDTIEQLTKSIDLVMPGGETDVLDHVTSLVS